MNTQTSAPRYPAAKLRRLDRPARDNRYCGPAAISFLTGCNTDEAAWLIRRITGRKSVIGTTTGEIADVLRLFGMRLACVLRNRGAIRGGPTLAGLRKQRPEMRGDGQLYLVDAGEHWQLLTGDRYACGRVGGVVSFKDSRVKRRSRVAAVYRVEQRQPLTRPEQLAMRAQEIAERSASHTAVATLRKRARALGVVLEIDRGQVEITLPDRCYLDGGNGDRREGLESLPCYIFPGESEVDTIAELIAAVSAFDADNAAGGIA
jgi:hypothetical protein